MKQDISTSPVKSGSFFSKDEDTKEKEKEKDHTLHIIFCST
jgi:hypothetical protein